MTQSPTPTLRAQASRDANHWLCDDIVDWDALRQEARLGSQKQPAYAPLFLFLFLFLFLTGILAAAAQYLLLERWTTHESRFCVGMALALLPFPIFMTGVSAAQRRSGQAWTFWRRTVQARAGLDEHDAHAAIAELAGLAAKLNSAEFVDDEAEAQQWLADSCEGRALKEDKRVVEGTMDELDPGIGWIRRACLSCCVWALGMSDKLRSAPATASMRSDAHEMAMLWRKAMPAQAAAIDRSRMDKELSATASHPPNPARRL